MYCIRGGDGERGEEGRRKNRRRGGEEMGERGEVEDEIICCSHFFVGVLC